MTSPGSGDVDFAGSLRQVVEALRDLLRAWESGGAAADDLNRKRILLEELAQSDAATSLDLRRGVELLEEVLDECHKPALLDHAERWRHFQPAREEERSLLDSLSEVERRVTQDRQRAWGVLEQRLVELTRLHTPALRNVAAPEVEHTVDEWLAGNTSLERLRERLRPLCAPLHEIVWQTAREQLIGEVSRPASLSLFLGDLQVALEEAHIPSAALALQAARDTPTTSTARMAPSLIGPEDIPLRAGRARLVGLVRGRGALRLRLFGPAECPTEILPASEKARWFAATVKRDLVVLVLERMRQFATGSIAESCEVLVRSFATGFQRATAAKLDARRRRLDSELERYEGLLAEGEDLGQSVVVLEAAVQAALAQLKPLAERIVEIRPVRYRTQDPTRFAPEE